MKRLKLLLSLLFYSYYFLTGQTLDEREKKIVLQNNIKSETQWDYIYKNGVPSKVGKKVSVTTYSTSGNILEKDALGSKGEITGWEKYEYDESGNRILYERTSGTGRYKVASQFNSKNRITLEAGFNGVENFRKTYSYNSSGRPLEIVYLINNKEDEKFIYNHSGNIALVDIYTKGGSVTSKLRLVYDNNNNITEEKVLNTGNIEIEKKTYKYDSKGNILEEEKTTKGNFYYRLTYTYNQYGDLLTISDENLSEKKFIKKSFKYDTNGNLIEYKWRRGPDEEFNSKAYTYNSKGIYLTEHTLYPKTRFELMSKFEYEFY